MYSSAKACYGEQEDHAPVFCIWETKNCKADHLNIMFSFKARRHISLYKNNTKTEILS